MSDPTLRTPHYHLGHQEIVQARQEQSALDILDAIRDPLCYCHHYRSSYVPETKSYYCQTVRTSIFRPSPYHTPPRAHGLRGYGVAPE